MHSSTAPQSPKPAFRKHLLRALCAGAALVAIPPAAAVSEPSLVTGEKASYGYSWAEEVELGAQADRQLLAEMGIYDDPQLQNYVQAVGERIFHHSHFNSPSAPEIYRGTKFTFRVIDTPVVNAFALPGGFVYVTRGLLSHMQNEAQLAVVLGHEIAHVAARHSAQQARRSQWGQIGAVIGAVLGQEVLGDQVPGIGSAILNTGNRAFELFMLRYSRDAEHESDELGVTYATRAGYKAAESGRFFQSLQRLAAAEGKALPSWQTTHPDPGDRAQKVVQLAQQAAPGGGADNTGEGEFLRHIEGLVIGEDPRGGFADSGVFYHPTLNFRMPLAAGWQMENQRSAVILSEPNGRAIMGLRVAPGSRARDAAADFIRQNNVRVTGNTDTQVNGLPTHAIVGTATNGNSQVRVWNAFIEMNNRVYSILGYAPADQFDQARSTFETVAGGFAPWHAAGDVQPIRLKLVRSDRAAPLASFIPTALPPDLSPDAIAIMNQRMLNETVARGEVIKLPDAPARPAQYGVQGSASQQSYPTQSYPPAGSYPDNRGGYPPGNYPPATYPGYPSQPQGGGQQNYPNDSRAPGYPQSYPPQNYPQGYPSSGGQQSGGYPNQEYPAPSYPQSGAGYPSQNPAPGYPGQQGGYPPQSAPSSQPQWPREGSSGNLPQSQPSQPPRPSSSGQPNWPR